MTKGLLIVFTGEGKGKTTAALGMAVRAAGHGLPVCFIQFIKGSWRYGELEAVKRFEGLIDLHVMGKGFTWKSENLEEDVRLAREGWAFACQAIDSGKYHTVVLDEFTYLLHYGMLEIQPCLEFLARRNPAHDRQFEGRGLQSRRTGRAPRRAVENPWLETSAGLERFGKTDDFQRTGAVR